MVSFMQYIDNFQRILCTKNYISNPNAENGMSYIVKQV